MAAIAVTAADARTASDIVHQITAEAGVAITAGQAIRLNAAGKWVLALADAAPNADGVHIALRPAGVGQGLTGMRTGTFVGLDPALAIGSAVFLSGTVPGGYDTTAGAVSRQVGRIAKPGIMLVDSPV